MARDLFRRAPWLTLVPLLFTLTACTDDDPGQLAAAKTRPAALVTAGPQTGDLFITGTVSRGGEPVPGARVWVSLWPDDAGDIKVGEAVDTWDSPAVTSDSDGRYALRLDPDTLSSRYFPTDSNFLNFDFYLTSGAHLVSWSSTVDLLDRTQVWRTDDARTGDPVLDMSVDLGDSTLTETPSTGEATTSEITVMDGAPGSGP